MFRYKVNFILLKKLLSLDAITPYWSFGTMDLEELNSFCLPESVKKDKSYIKQIKIYKKNSI
jgi:hypothetical protein